VFSLLQVEASDRGFERVANVALAAIIVANVAAVVLETVQAIYLPYRDWFRAFEVLSVAVFSLEYLGRLWTCTLNPRFARPILGRIGYAFTPMAIIDLLAILPFFLPLGVDLRFVRAARLMRLTRAFKMARYSHALQTLGRVPAASTSPSTTRSPRPSRASRRPCGGAS
jgi:voltage-gated potassium channel